jgi:hypothetical protein
VSSITIDAVAWAPLESVAVMTISFLPALNGIEEADQTWFQMGTMHPWIISVL